MHEARRPRCQEQHNGRRVDDGVDAQVHGQAERDRCAGNGTAVQEQQQLQQQHHDQDVAGAARGDGEGPWVEQPQGGGGSGGSRGCALCAP